MAQQGSWSLDDAVAREREARPPAEPLEARPPMEWSLPFSWSQGALELSIATGLVLVAAILALVANGAAWGEVGAEGASIEVRLEDARIAFGGTQGGLDWNHQFMDDFDGIGQVRLAGTLFTVSLISLFVSAAVLGASIVVRTANVAGLASLLGLIAVALLLTATLLFPGGVERVWQDAIETAQFEGASPDIDWGAGLIVAWVAVGAVALGLAGAFVAMRHDDVS